MLLLATGHNQEEHCSQLSLIQLLSEAARPQAQVSGVGSLFPDFLTFLSYFCSHVYQAHWCQVCLLSFKPWSLEFSKLCLSCLYHFIKNFMSALYCLRLPFAQHPDCHTEENKQTRTACISGPRALWVSTRDRGSALALHPYLEQRLSARQQFH